MIEYPTLRILLISILLSLMVGWLPAQNQVGPLMTSKWQNFTWPYNAAFPGCDPDLYGAVNGHIGNSCGPTAIAKLLHYHQHPVHGSGSHSHTDVNGYRISADFEQTYYQWSEMKDELSSGETEDSYYPVAELIYHSFVLMEDPYEYGRSLADVCRLLKKYMRYDEDMYVAYRFDYSDAEFIQLLKSELDAGRPLLIESWTENSTPPGENGIHAGHYWNIDGYNDRGQFHVVWNVDGDADWHSFDNLGFDMSVYYIWALIGAKPDESQKVVDLSGRESGLYLKQHEPYTFQWTAKNVSQVHLDFSYDGENWVTIGENIDASQNSFTWEAGPDTNSKHAALRIRDAESPFYEFVYPDIEVYDQKKVMVQSPVSGDQYQAGTSLCLGWETTGIGEVNVGYRETGQSEWSFLAEAIPAGQRFFNWDLPLAAGKTIDVQITSSDQQIIGLADNLLISGTEQVGGPYLADSHALLLMHGDQSLQDQVNPNLGIAWNGQMPEYDFGPPGKGAAIRLDNISKTSHNSVVIDDQAYLNLRGAFTIDFWFKINSWSQSHLNKPYIITKPINTRYNNYCLQGNAEDGTVEFSVRTDQGTLSLSSQNGKITENKWYHVAMIHDAENARITLLLHNQSKDRIDEQSLDYESGAAVQTGVQNLLIGQAYAAGDYFDGWIDELRISRIVREFDAEWTEVESVVPENSLGVYPNPAHHQVNIHFGQIPNDRVIIRVYNQTGQVVHRFEDDVHSENLTFDCSNLRKGIYWVFIKTGATADYLQFVKID